jgi:hypothetical protein
MCGNTTISRRGKTGSAVTEGLVIENNLQKKWRSSAKHLVNGYGDVIDGFQPSSSTNQ